MRMASAKMSNHTTNHAAALDRAPTLLVGTPLSVQELHHTLGTVDPPPVIVGCILVGACDKNGDHPMPLPVLGTAQEMIILTQHHRIERVLLSLPAAMGTLTRQLAEELDRLRIVWRIMPTLADQMAGRLGPLAGPRVELDTHILINRQPRPLDEAAIRQTLTDRCVLITGAGGSIGSQLARMVSRFDPCKLVLVDRSENGLFEIDREIARVHPDLPRTSILHDVTDAARTMGVVSKHKPRIIFHAAAHKHVPMMEDHPAQAVENNFFGTRSIADAAASAGVERFVMISTDKAVNPSSVMGATKRLAELYIQHLNARSDCAFSMVRFGNVLESACSVIPIWNQQLARGGPITVTHPRMHRYFMTIPEAAGLVLQSAALSNTTGGEGGEVFLLDMGQPIRILDLARRFIRSHGLEPGLDVAIRFTGPRPGEKLFEELAYDDEDMIPTRHESIRIWRTGVPDPQRMNQMLTTFDRLRAKGNSPELNGDHQQDAHRQHVIAALRAAVPEMVRAAAG